MFINTITINETFNSDEYTFTSGCDINDTLGGEVFVSTSKKNSRNNDRSFSARFNSSNIVYYAECNEGNGNIKPWMLNMLSSAAKRHCGRTIKFWNKRDDYCRPDYKPK